MQEDRINVTKTFLPSREKLDKYIDQIYSSSRLTNNGPLVQELTRKLEDYLGVENLLLVANGTLALQVAYKVLGLKGSVITTPFSFVATTSSLVWEGLNPRFSDIDAETFCMDPVKAKEFIDDGISGIVPVHVFGNACDVDSIGEIAEKYNLKVVYDAAHAFGIRYKGKSLLSYGDASILSFHATKVFHSIEGGAIVFRKRKDLEKARKMINFGIDGSGSISSLGINAKMNEFEAAMGLCVLEDIDMVMERRKKIWNIYKEELTGCVEFQKWTSDNNNYGYFPVLFDSEENLLEVKDKLNHNNIFPRRYFYPSLNKLNLSDDVQKASLSESISNRVLCLPFYPELHKDVQLKIVKIVKDYK